MSPESTAGPAVRRRILAIDGGGIRCTIAIEVLLELERGLGIRSGDASRRLWQHFDLVAGTSGGAIIGTAVALGLAMTEIREFVLANARNMFRPARWWRRLKSSWYDKSVLESNLRAWFGEHHTLGSPALRTLLLLIMRNWSTDSPWLVSNNPKATYNAPGRDDDNLQLHLWQLARASAAAPGYYVPETITFGRERPYDFVFVDGGLTGFLNPAFKAFLYATTGPYGLCWSTGEEHLSIVSVGAGDVRRFRAGETAADISLLRALKGVPNAMLHATIREQDLLCRTFGRCITGGPIDREVGDMRTHATAVEPRLFRYHRVNPLLTVEGLQALGCGHIRPRDIAALDAVTHVDALSEIGQATAKRVVPALLAECGFPDPG